MTNRDTYKGRGLACLAGSQVLRDPQQRANAQQLAF